jgi:hypothetical protein
MFNFTAPGGRAYLTIRSSNPDPSRRFNLTVSDGFGIGAEGLRELASKIAAFADEVDPPAKPQPTSSSKKSSKKATPEGGDA